MDANWDKLPSGALEQLLAHAVIRNVGLFLWFNAGGPNNAISEGPRDRMFDRGRRREELQRIRAMGVAGVKVDFWHSDKQESIARYRALLADAAEFGLLVVLHGCTVPRGWEREFPNLLSSEAVAGAEHLNGRSGFAALAPHQNVILAVTRGNSSSLCELCVFAEMLFLAVIGPTDYTPAVFSRPRFARVATSGHELALTMLFVSGVLHLADSAATLSAISPHVKRFLQQLPSVWVASVGLLAELSGERGAKCAVARQDRHGDWFVGGVAVTAQTLNVPLSFLPLDSKWDAVVLANNLTSPAVSLVSAADVLTVKLFDNDGFVVHLSKVRD